MRILISIALISFASISMSQDILGEWKLDQVYIDSVRHFEEINISNLIVEESTIISYSSESELTNEFNYDMEDESFLTIYNEEFSLEYEVLAVNECFLILMTQLFDEGADSNRLIELRYTRLK